MQGGAALVTGSSRGLGRAIAEELLTSYRMVFGCSRGESSIEHPNYRHLISDLTDGVSVERLFNTVGGREFPPFDLLIHNAGISHSRLGIMTSLAEADDIIRGNLLATFAVDRAAMKLMRRRRFGRIINFSSINARQATLGSSLYNATKAGVESLTRSLSRECGDIDVTLNCLGLSIVSAGGMAETLPEASRVDRVRTLVKKQSLDLADIMHAIRFFASPASRAITGETLYFGGGT